MSRSELREKARTRAGGRCDWPTHNHPGAELSHIHSIGMGGTPDGTRDHMGNVAWLCKAAALVSDGIMPSGGPAQYRLLHIQLLGAGVFEGMSLDRRGWERAEALRRHVDEMYG